MKVLFANDYTDDSGRTYGAGTTADLPNGDARSLIFRGKALEAPACGVALGKAPRKPSSAMAETTTPERDKGKKE